MKIEISEETFVYNLEKCNYIINLYRENGFKIAIDDFGTGYSSLSYLKRFPATCLKIDQSFIRDVMHNDEDAAITKAIIAMAHSLNLLVVAEGVETQAQMDFLKAHSCNEIQGYLISKPISAQALTEFMLERQPAV